MQCGDKNVESAQVVIRQVIEYNAADRQLAWAHLTDLDNGAEETTAWSRANARAEAAEPAIAGRWLTSWPINQRLWLRVQDAIEEPREDTRR